MMKPLTEEEIGTLTYLVGSIRFRGHPTLSDELLVFLKRGKTVGQQVSHNQGCNASRYPYN